MEHIIILRETRQREAAQRQKTLILHRKIRDMSDPFKDPNFRKLYRFTAELALRIIEEIKDFYPKMSYGTAIPEHIKFLAALHFYAQGSYQKPDGRDAIISLSQASVSRAIAQTTDALNMPQVLRKWIKFPDTQQEIHSTIDKNYRKFKIPGVLGFVDGTHIVIKKPVEHEELYINRKGQHSLNVQVVCDSNLLILNLLARYPGSTHDAFIWKASAVRDKMKTNNTCWLLGDSGYPLEPWLMTPVLNAPDNSQAAKYTQMHILARNSIERLFGVWKGRFRCLHKHRTLEYAPVKVGHIINACAVLHNICIQNNVPMDEDDIVQSGSHDTTTIGVIEDNDLYQQGQEVRDNLMNRLG